MIILNKILGFTCAVLALISLMLVFFAIGDLFGPDPQNQGAGFFIGLAVFFSGLTWLFTKTAGKLFAKDKRPEKKDGEREILLLAKSSQGKLTVPEVAANTELSLDEAQIILDKMVTQGVVHMDLRDDGVIYYVFPGLGA